MMKNRLLPIALSLALIGSVSATSASAQTSLNQRTVLTFSQPIEVPGQVLPAGTYTFELSDSMANRHIVQIMDEKGTKVVALVLAVPNRRMTTTDDTVVRFAEVAAGQPQAMRAWFYPGQTVGQEMVYPKTRAQQLAATANVAVPSVDDSFYNNATVDSMKTADVAPVTAAANTTTAATTQPATQPAPVDPAPRTQSREELPRTASPLPLIALFGFVTLAMGLALRGYSTGRPTR